MIILKYVIIWLGLVVLAIVNGGLRNELYGKYIPELYAHQISTATGLLIFSAYIWIVSAFWRILKWRDAVIICFVWLLLTILFEFIFGHYVMGHSWSRLFHDYNIFEGRLWILVLLWTVFAPYVVYKLREKP